MKATRHAWSPPTSTSSLLGMAKTQVIHENDVVALRDRVGDWPAGTVGAAVSIYAGAAQVEVTDNRGHTLDLITVPNELLELRPRHAPAASVHVEA
jgi:hypothetical protein